MLRITSTADESKIIRLRREAAEMEHAAAQMYLESARIRLETAQAEQDSARQTLAMAELVAASMYNREMPEGN